MEYRTLGRTGLKVGVVGFGTTERYKNRPPRFSETSEVWL